MNRPGYQSKLPAPYYRTAPPPQRPSTISALSKAIPTSQYNHIQKRLLVTHWSRILHDLLRERCIDDEIWIIRNDRTSFHLRHPEDGLWGTEVFFKSFENFCVGKWDNLYWDALRELCVREGVIQLGEERVRGRLTFVPRTETFLR